MPSDTARQERQRGVQYVVDRPRITSKDLKFLQGMSIGFDAAGAVMYALTAYGQLEGQLHINLKEKYFPAAEVGIGHSDHTNEDTDLHFRTSSPYIRVGCDYNFNKDLASKNRIFGGLRLAYTHCQFDLDGPPLTDPTWGSTVPYSLSNLSSNVMWMEFVFGLEAHIWHNLHIGWSARYRRRLHQSVPEVGQAWYVPGFGKNDSHNFGATFNIIFDI